MRLALRLVCVGVAFVSVGYAQAALVYALTNTNTILLFDSETPGQIQAAHTLSNFHFPSDNLIGLAYRPESGYLYALGSQGNLYFVGTNNWSANRFPSAIFPFAHISGWKFGFSVNPITDRARVISNLGQNVSVSLDSFYAPLFGPDAKWAPGEPEEGGNPVIHGLAYTNNFATAESTKAYGLTPSGIVSIDPEGDALARRVSSSWFDVDYGIGGLTVRHGSRDEAYAVVTHSAFGSTFYRADLETGALTLVGDIGFRGPGEFVRSIVVVPEPASLSALAIGALALLRRRR